MTKLTIDPASEPQRRKALELVFSYLEPEQQRQQVDNMLTVLGKDSARWVGLLGAWRGTSLVGATLGQIQAGRVATVCPPCLTPDEPMATADSLLTTLCDWFRSQDVRLAQALLSGEADFQRDLLERHSFCHLADVLYLVCDLENSTTAQPTGELRFVRFRPAMIDRLAAIVEQTYRDSLDCPALNGVQTIQDVLAGYRACGVFGPQFWLLVAHKRRDVGCVLLADHPEKGNLELVYMGLIPEARGRGWGLQLVSHAQWLARCQGRLRLVAAVDAANAPALRTYEQAGFAVWDKRAAYVRIFPT